VCVSRSHCLSERNCGVVVLADSAVPEVEDSSVLKHTSERESESCPSVCVRVRERVCVCVCVC